MNDPTSIPPFRTLTPGRLQTRKAHLLAEIAREPRKLRLPLMLFPPPGLRLAVTMAVLLCVAIGGALLIANNKTSSTNGPTREQSAANTMDLPPLRSMGPGALALPSRIARKRISLSEASVVLGARVVLPRSSLLEPGDTHIVWAIGKCPMHPRGARRSASACQILVTFPAQSVGVAYRFPAPVHPVVIYRSYLRDKGVTGKLTDLGGIRALVMKTAQPGRPHGRPLYRFSFVIDGIQFDVVGLKDPSRLEAVARSIIARAK